MLNNYKIKQAFIKIKDKIVTALLILAPFSLGLLLMFFPTDDTTDEMIHLHRFTFMIGLLLIVFVVKWALKVYVYTKEEENNDNE
jgi:hypothetical protein